MVRRSRHYGSCWALQHQKDDRWRREQIPELLRKESKRHRKRIAFSRYGVYAGANCDESEFDPDYPFDHLLWMSVNAEVANRWWQEDLFGKPTRLSTA